MIRDSGSFKKTIVLLNTGNPMEVDWVEEYDVDAVLWIGCPGEKGFTGVANIRDVQLFPRTVGSIR